MLDGALGCSGLDLLSVNAVELRELLQAGKVNSVQLVREYLRQITRYDTALKAFISVAPEHDLISTAELLDKERLGGRVRSQLHGIPVVLKVCGIQPTLETSVEIASEN